MSVDRATIDRMARAIHREFSYVERQPSWDDLHEEAKACWYDLARAAAHAMDSA
jgi:hypothetical protein